MFELFLNPLMLWGAGLAAVPIVLHLIMRQKPKHLEFPALRFIRERLHANSRRLKLRHLLLLALRVGLICLLATALARPSVKVSGSVMGSREAPVAAALVFDTSPRMDYRHQNETRMARAQTLAKWLIDQLPEESNVAVLDTQRLGTGDGGAEIANLPPTFSVDLGAARHRVDNLSFTYVNDPFLEVVDRAVELLQSSPRERKEIYLFTDLTRSAWSANSSRWRHRLEQPGGVSVYVLDVGSTEPRNYTLGELKLSSQVLFKDGNLEITSDLRVRGKAEEKTVEIYLTTPDSTDATHWSDEKLGQVTVKPADDGSAPIIFPPIKARNVGAHQGYAKILGSDGLEEDDRRYFTVEVANAWNVLLASPEPVSQYTRFVKKALAPRRLELQQRAPFQVTAVSEDQLAKPIQDYSAVCLIDPGPLSVDAWKELATFAAEGGGVAIFLGRNARKDDFNTPAAQALLPGKLDFLARATTNLTAEGSQHVVLREFADWPVPWDLWPVNKYWHLELDESAGATVVMYYANGQPAILERRIGRGKVITMTTPVSERAASPDAWNQLTGFEPWPFTVLASELATYLVGGSEVRLNYLPGDTAQLRLRGDTHVDDYLLVTPWEKVYGPRPAQRERIEERTTNMPGNYRIRSKQSDLDRGYSVNMTPDETDLSRIDDDTLKSMWGEVPFRLVRDQSQFEREVGAARVGRELYPWIILLVAVILAIEFIVANRFYREPAGKPTVARAAA